MCVYNAAPYLSAAIQSILDQTYPDFEFLIINDGSTDESREIISSYADSRIRVIDQQNLGLTKSLNRGLDSARGDYIARMDADDVSFSDRLSRQVAYLDTNPEITVLGGGVETIDCQGNRMAEVRFPMSTTVFCGICVSS